MQRVIALTTTMYECHPRTAAVVVACFASRSFLRASPTNKLSL